jgi:tetratricopeptide (TPR) repeat protein
MAQFDSGRSGSPAEKPKINYSSKLLAALNKFAGAISVEVKHPMVEKYGEAYDYLIQGDTHRLRDEVEEAIRAYEKAIALNPMFVEAKRRSQTGHGDV